MKVCVPVDAGGNVDPRWGRAQRVAVAEVGDGVVRSWTEFDVGWDTLHDSGTEGSHHARVARFLREQQVQAVAVAHLGAGMQRMLDTMSISVLVARQGSARDAALAAAGLPG